MERADQRSWYGQWPCGWVILIRLADIDGSFKINKGLRIARQLLCDITHMGVPVGVELLDTISPQYISVGDCMPRLLSLTVTKDLLSWGAIGMATV